MNRQMIRNVTTALCAFGLLIVGASLGRTMLGQAGAEGIPPDGEALYYSGVLYDGTTPVDESKNIVIAFFDNDAGTGTPECQVTASATPVVSGRFRVQLADAACVAAIRSVTPGMLHVQISVDGTSLGLRKLGAVPYAVEADSVRGIGVASNDNVSIGSVATSGVPLTVQGAQAGVHIQAGSSSVPHTIFSVSDGASTWTPFQVRSDNNVYLPNIQSSPGSIALRHPTPTLDFDNSGGTKRVQLFTDTSGFVFNDVSGDSTFRFKTNTNAERLFIDSSGNVGIGTTSPQLKLHVAGSAGNPTGTWTTPSDRRLKRGVEPLSDALSTVSRLEGHTFRWKDAAKDLRYGRVRGLIAQEVEEVIPEWVGNGPDGYKRLEPIGESALFIEAIKELHGLVKKQREQLSDQQARLDQLEAIVTRRVGDSSPN